MSGPRDGQGSRLVCAALLLHACLTFKAWRSLTFLSAEGRDGLVSITTPVFDVLGGPWVPGLFWTELYLSFLFLAALGGVLLLCAEAIAWPRRILAFVVLNEAYFALVDVRLLDDWRRIHLAISAAYLLSRGATFHARTFLAAWHLALGATRLAGSEGWPILGAAVFLTAPAAWFAGSAAVRLSGLWATLAAHAAFAAAGAPGGLYLMAPLCLASFWELDAPVDVRWRLSWSDAGPGLATAAALAAALWHFAIPGDVRITGEGRLSGLSLPPSVLARWATVELHTKERVLAFSLAWPGESGATAYAAEVHEKGRVERLPRHMVVRAGERPLWNPDLFLNHPQHALDPYALYHHAKRICRDLEPERLSLRLSLRVSGRPDPVRVLDLDDFCRRVPRYRAFWRNDWIGR